MFITIITDCICANARGRQETRLASIFNSPVNFIETKTSLEASGNLIDVLDASQGADGVILVNVAPRNGKAKAFFNGSPFAYFSYKKTLIITSVDDQILSMIKRFGFADEINVLNLEESVRKYAKKDAERIIKTQFRSYEFLPLAAKWLKAGKKLPAVKYSDFEVLKEDHLVWWVDNFGNCKTTMIKEDLNDELILKLKKKVPGLVFCERLKDVPDNKIACIEGSSGFGNKRFLEIDVQGKSASKIAKLKVGDKIS